MTRSDVCGCSHQRDDLEVFSCAAGDLIGMTDWAFPIPAPAAGPELSCARAHD
jgi:hypothetical protein